MNARGGRPRNSGLDDTPAIEAVEAAMAAGTHASERAAVLAVAGDDESVVRRIQRKLHRRRRARAGDLSCLPDLSLAFGEPAERDGFLAVPVGLDGDRELALAHCAHLHRPVLMKMVGGSLDLRRDEIPDHPVFRALDSLPDALSWDHAGYRHLCAMIGIDPDHGRPLIHPVYAAYLDGLATGTPRENPLEPARSAFAPAGCGLDGGLLGLLSARLHREGAWDGPGLAAEIRASESLIDWAASPQRADLDLVRTPWTPPDAPDGIAVSVGRVGEGGLYLGLDPFSLLLPRDPASHELAAREAVRRLASAGLGFPVDAGTAAWLDRASDDAATAPSRTPRAEPEHWAAMANAACAAYDRYASGRGGPPAGPVSEPLSMPDGWAGEMGQVEWDRAFPSGRRMGGAMDTGFGLLHLAPRGRAAAIVTSSSFGLRLGERRARFSCAFSLPHPGAPSALPLVGRAFADFEAAYLDDGSAVTAPFARALVASCLMPATTLIRDHLDVEPEHDPERRRRGVPDTRLDIRVREALAAGRSRRSLAVRRMLERLVG